MWFPLQPFDLTGQLSDVFVLITGFLTETFVWKYNTEKYNVWTDVYGEMINHYLYLMRDGKKCKRS